MDTVCDWCMPRADILINHQCLVLNRSVNKFASLFATFFLSYRKWMRMLFENMISVYFIAFVVFWFEENVVLAKSFEVIRGRNDSFSNLLCSKGFGVEFSRCEEFCNKRGAVCDESNHCEYCICNIDGNNTYAFLNLEKEAKCVRDEDIIPETVEPGTNFRIREGRSHYCATPSTNNNLEVLQTCTLDSPGMLWIWTTGYQLKNIDRSYCIEVPRSNGGKKVTITPCSVPLTNQRLKFSCVESRNGETYSYSIKLKNRKLYLEQSRDYYVVVGPAKYKWMNYSDTHRSVCSTQTKGCYRFADGSFLQLLRNETCHGEKDCFSKKIAAPIFAKNTNCALKWTESKFMRDKGPWDIVNGENIFFSILKPTRNTRVIKIANYANASQIWNGSLLRLEVTCRGRRSKEEHCVLLKFESLRPHVEVRRYSPTISPKQVLRSGTSSSMAAVISVSIVILVLIVLVIFGFLIFYRRRKRNQDQPVDRTEMRSQDPQNIYEDPSPIYEAPNDDYRETGTDEGYEGLRNPAGNPSGTGNNAYDYIDREEQNMNNPASCENEYSCASNDVARNMAALPQPSAPGPAIYHTLEGPEYAENPTSTHDGSSNPIDEQAESPTYAILEESNAKNGEATEVEPDKDSSEATGVPSGDSDLFYHVLDSSQGQKSV